MTHNKVSNCIYIFFLNFQKNPVSFHVVHGNPETRMKNNWVLDTINKPLEAKHVMLRMLVMITW